MTKRPAKTQTETAQQAYQRNLTQAINLVNALQAHLLNAADKIAAPHWGHVGDMAEIVKNLRGAGHYAGIAGCVEE